MIIALTLVPFVVFLGLLLLKFRLLHASWAFFVITGLVLVFKWGIYPSVLVQSGLKGFLVALDIFFIISGALYFLKVVEKMGTMDVIIKLLTNLSPNRGIQVILLAWFLQSFLEGTSGFGTPVAVVAPILISMGIAPLTAVVISMLGNSAPGAFGAVGTPIRVGLATVDTFGVAPMAGAINLSAFFIPTVMMYLTYKKLTKWNVIFSVFAGLVMMLASYLFTFWGAEMPSVLGPLVGLLITIVLLKTGVFGQENISKNEKLTKADLLTLVPYGLLLLLLIIGKFALSDIGLVLNFGLVHKVVLFNPGFSFLIAGIISSFVFLKNQSLDQLAEAVKKAIEPLMVIFPITASVQAMIYSSRNVSGLPGYLDIFSSIIPASWLLVVAPVFGVLGAFVTGSATVANIMFGGIVEKIALSQQFSLPLALALLVVGSAAGNMVALADILPALVITNQPNQEMAVVKRVLGYCVGYVALAIVLGLVIFR